MTEEFGKEFWEERYRGHTAVWSGRPNPHLLAEAEDLTAGTALDAGCGEGADAVWLASRGWRVTAVDFAATALRRGREHAENVGVASRIDWVPADLTGWTPAPATFDLVSSQYLHLPAAPREALFRRLAAAVAPGGTLLIVGHHPSDRHTTVQRPRPREVYFTAEEVAASLDPDRWDIDVAETRPRPAAGHESHGSHGSHNGHETTVHDAVLRARKRL